jgi:hypothetical protein
VIKFVLDEAGLVLEFETEDSDGEWVQRELDSKGKVTVSRVFELDKSDLLSSPMENESTGGMIYFFRFGARDTSYVRIPGRHFNIPNDIMITIDGGLKFERKLFVSERHVSIFRKISAVVGTEREIAIGGARPDAIPVETFLKLLKLFPNTTELDRYASARVATIIGDFFDGMKDWKGQYEAYLDRRPSVQVADMPDMSALLQSEIAKYTLIRNTIAGWLASPGVRPEKDWQTMILEFILLIFPRYVAVLHNVHVEDHYSRPGYVSSRYIDIALVDSNGNLDVIEIKRPFDDLLLSTKTYRSNWVPTKELSGTIMQAEKYLFHLSKWGVAGEKRLMSKYGPQLPPGMKLRITNPKALVVLGRDRRTDGTPALDEAQLFDLELIKRKYANMIDILTYDDLLRRLDNIISALGCRISAQPGSCATV